MSEWISVKDRHPAFLVSVLVCVGSGKFADIGCYMHHNTYSVKSDPNLVKGLVTHWMPLPEPPKCK